MKRVIVGSIIFGLILKSLLPAIINPVKFFIVAKGRLSIRILLAFIATQITSCAPMVSFVDMGPSLDKRIGQVAPNFNEGNSRYYQYRDVNDKNYELIWKRPDACSYALEVRKLDDIITGWHYLESNPPSDCKFQNVKQLM